ncbi:RDD family protein [Helicobacter sp. WB40]|uniref:RDD family protein n=1 Tax=Helicobacter sp. WB40 TaxID=3004130 RepID=UPI0022EBBB9F|nr:RDD family protein [Helicobacter sp. WB40]MDA3967801.1 RDD family protein [Helicobacter sp. WB40]
MRFRHVKKISKKIITHDNNDNLATFFDRFKAQVVDTFMIYMPILYFITYVIMGSAEAFRDSVLAPLFGVILYGIVVSIFMSFGGQTPGKKAYEIIVKRDDNKKITFLFAMTRFFLFLVSGFLIFGIFMPLFRKDKKTLHDLILQTKVCKKV